MKSSVQAAFAATFVLFATSVFADSVERRPTSIDYEHVVDNSAELIGLCAALLSPPPEKGSCDLAIVSTSSSSQSSENKVEIVSGQFEFDERSLYRQKPVPAGYDFDEIDKSKLQDSTNSETYTGQILKRIVNNEALSNDATLIVDGDSNIDTSLLVKYARGNQFVIEQKTSSERFNLNMLRLRQRLYKNELSVFDFSPATDDAIRDFGVGGTAREWKRFSRRIETMFSTADTRQALEPRTLEALRSRLLDSTGKVVVIYGHSDGESIWLDTDNGIERLTPEDIREIGEAAGGRLPPILLLNCETESVIAPAFLSAGSPFVAATDKPMTLTDATRFLSSIVTKVYGDKKDVIDAFYDSGNKLPFRLRPMADRVDKSTDASQAGMSQHVKVIQEDYRYWILVEKTSS